MKENPLISVLMPVYNGEKYLREAIDSVLAQTYTNFELIIANDASTDSTAQIVNSYSSSKIRYVCNDINRGIVFTRNLLVQQAKGDYIAVIDSDDLWSPNKLEEQIKYMEKHSECYLCGTWTRIIDERNNVVSRIQHPTSNENIKVNLLFQSSFVHSSVMIRCTNDELLHYDSSYPVCEDYDLWLRICHSYSVHNIRKYLTFYRIHQTNISKEKEILLANKRKEIIARACSQFGPFEKNEIDIVDGVGNLNESILDCSLIDDWKSIVAKLISYNNMKNLIPKKELVAFLLYRWVFYNASQKNYKNIPQMFFYKTNLPILFRTIQLINMKIFFK